MSSKGLRRLCFVALLVSSGCYATSPIKPSELTRLDGYENGAPKGGAVSVLSPTNQPVGIDDGSLIFLDLPEGTRGGEFRSIQVRDGVFYGETMHGQAVQAPLGSISAARVKGPNPQATTQGFVLLGIAIAILAGVGLVVYGLSTIRPE